MSTCIFCKIISREAPAGIVYEDDLTLAFMDIGQVNPGHTIVTLKSHVENIYGINDTQAAAAFCTAMRISRALEKAMRPDGMTLLQANGAAGWQTVFHFHIHVLPRYAGDGADLTWPAVHPPREVLEQYAAQVRAALGSLQD